MLNSLRKVFNLIKPVEGNEVVANLQSQEVNSTKIQTLESQLLSSQESLAKSQIEIQSIRAELSVAKAQIETITSISKNEEERIQAQIVSVRAELDSSRAKVLGLTGDIKSQLDEIQLITQNEKNTNEKYEKNVRKLVEIEKELSALRIKYDQFTAEKNKAISDKQFLEGKRKELEENLTQTINEKNQALKGKQLVERQLLKLTEETKLTQVAKEKGYLANKQLTSKVDELQFSLNEQKKSYEAMIGENKRLKDDLDAMLLHLHQVQEELERYYSANQTFKSESLLLKSRWERFQKRMPNYLDFKLAAIQSYDGLAESQVMTFKVEEYIHNDGGEFPELLFKIDYKDGMGSIVLIDPAGIFDDIKLTPKLTLSDNTHAARFRVIGSAQWQKMVASISVLEYGVSNGWKGFSLPEGYDPSFYKNLFSQLIVEFKKLPEIMRFDSVKLKRELQNPDYEHLWLEIYGLSYKRYNKPKLEMRLGAQLIKGVEFSQLPKYEFPLIDGKLEPFESWFSESADDFGSKFELRFALDQNVFDFATWSKLTLADRELTYLLISLTPIMLEKMIAQQVPINRDWKDWLTLANRSAALLAALIQRSRQEKASNEKGVDVGDNLKPATLKSAVKEVTIKSKAKNATPVKNKSLPAKTSSKLAR
jgi:hypothetical protein